MASAFDPASTVPISAEVTAGNRSRRADHDRERLLVARKWAYQLRGSTYLPMPWRDVENELLGMVNTLFDALLHGPLDAQPVDTTAIRLVGMNCVGQAAFQRTMDVLGKAMLKQPELHGIRHLPEKVVSLLGTLSASYVDAIQRHTLAQQEALNRTMILIGRDSRAGMRAAEARLAAVLDTSPTGIAITDPDCRFLRTNQALCALLGHSPGEFAELTLFDLLAPEDEESIRTARDQLLDGDMTRLRQRRMLVNKAGDKVPVTLAGMRLREECLPDRLVLIMQDDSELRLLQNQLTRQSLHDVVTGLPNRQFFTTRLESTLHRVDQRTGATVYHLDLDAFAMVADGLGRQVGDQLLKVVADRLKAVVADEQAMVARLDSDEFAILVENRPDTPDIATTVSRINDELAEPVYIDGQGVTVSTSIGVVHRPRGDVDPTELLRASDLALRRAKRHGRRQWELFDENLDERDRARFNLATTMPSAWELGEVQLDYRPQVALASGAVVGLEPVLRWDHPTFGVVAHQQCVELAEQTGLMLSLGDWMLHSACAQIRRWSRLNLPPVIELSDSQAVDPDLVGRVLRILAEGGLPPSQLRLGIPVHLLHGDRPEPTEHLRVLADAGVGVVLSGFGSTATDLVFLEDLPVTAVRIGERLATAQAQRGPSLLDKALSGMITIVHEAGGTVAVDGVHTAAQADWWRTAGADTGLGGHFTKW
ncbi:MAG TPA: EAL domain-containing protein [Pseudonocardiaceae bacterium]|nr:EAL domain-containing protein [Pseudonocardiaceae bacterium]